MSIREVYFIKRLWKKKRKSVITKIPIGERVEPSKELKEIIEKAEKILGKKLGR